ncbi:MAG TPA: class I SAM-dependent methyltransferase [Candidatus Acidoferrales bacterium]|nr:class I SAM-dependent methyltransferase [Candidatus Acidoferrales bacterium]
MSGSSDDFRTFGRAYHERFRENPFTRVFGQRGPLLRFIARYVPGGRLLDIGCGQGAWLSQAVRRFRVSGCDTSEYALEGARRNVPAAERLAAVDANRPLPFESGSFDAVTALDVVEHLHAPETLIAEAWRLLRPGGVFALTTPNPRCRSATSWKPQDWHGARDVTHINMKPADAWVAMIEAQGFKTLDVRFDGLWDVPYSSAGKRWRLAKLFEHAAVQLPSILAYNAGIRIPEPLGENAVVLAVKPSA